MRKLLLTVIALALLNLHCSHSDSTSMQSASLPANSQAIAETQNSVVQAPIKLAVPSKVSRKKLLAARAPDLAGLTLDESWQHVSSDDGIIIHKREKDGSSMLEVRGETIIYAPISKVLQILSDSNRKTEWVDRLVTAKKLSPESPHYLVEYNHSDAPWPVKDRDFLFQALVEVHEIEKMVVIHLESIQNPAVPEQECCIRGELKKSIYALRSISGGSQTQIAMRVSVDPKGSIPRWLVNRLQESWPRESLLALQKQAANPNIAEHQYFKKVFDRLWAKDASHRLATQ